VPHSSAITDPLQKIDLTTALQYGTAQGYPPLYSFIRQFVRENLHPNVPYLNGPDIILTVGNTDGFNKFVEEFAYMNAVQGASPRGLRAVPVKIDLEGMLPFGPGGLEDVLENWDESQGKRPQLMYTVTIGQNPTGGTLSVQRRKELYAICSKYDIIIIEDDPYWYLQFPSVAKREAEARGTMLSSTPDHKSEDWKSSGFPYLDSLVPSYLNFDYDGRVIRLDTFSKTVAPGCRLGWITAQPAVIERLLRITETSSQQPSGFVQSTISELIIGPQPALAEFKQKTRKEQATFTGWQTDGWVRWLEGLRGTYERRMNRMCGHLEEGRFQLKQGTPLKTSESDWAVISKTKMYSFNWPRGGMFVWVQMHFDSHPLWDVVPGAKLASSLWIFLTQKPHLVLATPGTAFSPTPEIEEAEGWKYFRLCFAAVSEEEVEKSSKRFAEGIKAFWLIKDKKELDDIENDINSKELEGELVDLGLNFAC